MSLKDPKNQQHMNDFISEHAPLITSTLKKLRNAGHIPDHIEDEDLHFAGVHGLIDAMHKYQHDVAANTAKEGDTNPFAKYAKDRIRGKILDLAKQSDVVPKQLRERAKNLQALEAKGEKPED
jgi:RNA polymerase sigma factor for flagellar operon FliA